MKYALLMANGNPSGGDILISVICSKKSKLNSSSSVTQLACNLRQREKRVEEKTDEHFQASLRVGERRVLTNSFPATVALNLSS